MLIDRKIPPSILIASLSAGGSRVASASSQHKRSGAFAQALGQVRQTEGAGAGQMRTVSSGDTLIGLVRQQAASQGVSLKPAQEFRIAQRVAFDNGIQNPNWIFPGQKISLDSLQPELQSMQSAAPVALAAPPLATAPSVLAAGSTVSATAASPVKDSGAHPVLDKTLARAVAKGFIPLQEKEAVYDKILQLASTHRFNPDDFARMTLMESDGMNPRASNQRCHGIIQFCDGASRGAASAGYAANPRAILDLSVHKQLSLVDKYFEEVGLKNQGSNGLEDLYLSVLRPASRSESQPTQALNIPGLQSSYLHVGRDTSAPITRQSIRQGLLQNAAERLGQLLTPAAPRLQALRGAEGSGGAN